MKSDESTAWGNTDTKTTHKGLGQLDLTRKNKVEPHWKKKKKWVFGRGRIELLLLLCFCLFLCFFMFLNSIITHLDKNILNSVWLFSRFWEEPPILHKSTIRQHDSKTLQKPLFWVFLWPENGFSHTLKCTNSTLKSKRKLDFQIIKTKWLLQIHIINSGVTRISREPVPHERLSLVFTKHRYL